LDSFSLIRKFRPIQWLNCDVINFHREMRLFLVGGSIKYENSLKNMYLIRHCKSF
jgi:hypothetical protein